MTQPADDTVDHETEFWPVPEDMREDLDKIKHTFRAVPLGVFARNKFINTKNAESFLAGALVMIFFELYHYAIHVDNKDSYNGMIEQIQVLQLEEVRPVHAHKRKNVRDGPIRHLHTSRQLMLNSSAPTAVASSSADGNATASNLLALANGAENGMSKTDWSLLSLYNLLRKKSRTTRQRSRRERKHRRCCRLHV